MKPILTLLIAAALTLSANAAEKIEGAFGFKLGDVLDLADARLVKEDVPEPVPERFEFKPTNPNPAFASYYVWVTPNSHRIKEITAVGTFQVPENGDFWNQLEIICALLHRKYGSGPFPFGRDIKITQGRLIVRCYMQNRIDPKNVTVSLDYLDLDLSSQGAEETVDNHLKGADATGL